VGKTRLAVRAATDHQRGFADGAWWVDLAEIRDPALVATAVVAALDLRDQAASTPVQVLLSHFRDRQLLLVLDNCEHVLPGDVKEALATFSAAVRSLHSAGNLVDELDSTVVLADMWVASCRPGRARRLYEQVLRTATADGVQNSSNQGLA
jgi:hypothetical protein